MKNELDMVLFSRRTLTEAFAREQITALSDFGGGLMRPDKCGGAEPIRTPFDRSSLAKPIHWLTEPLGCFFYQKGRPIHASGEMWNRTHPPSSRFPSPIITNYCTGRFDGKWAARVGITRVEDFVREMFRITFSDFALLTPNVDREAKNKDTSSYSYQGLNLDLGLPGLYWVNLFSKDLADWLGLREISPDLAQLITLRCGGVMLKFGDSPDEARTNDILRKQRATIDWLGSAKFFDIRSPDRKLEPPAWDLMPLTNS